MNASLAAPDDLKPTDVVTYIRGFNDGQSASNPAQPAPPASNSIPPGDLTAVLRAAKPGEQIALQANAQYITTGEVDMHAAGVTVVGNNASIACTLPVGSSSNFKILAPNITFDRVNITAGRVVFRVAADKFTLSNSIISNMLTAVQTDMGGTNLSILNTTVKAAEKVGAYITQSGSLIDGCTFDSSAREYCVRYEIDVNNMKLNGAILRNSMLTNVGSQKQAIGVRIGDGVQLRNLTINGAVRWGQVPGATQPPVISATQFAEAGVMDSVTFINVQTQTPQNAIQVDKGATVTISNCMFKAPVNKIPAVALDQMSVLTLTNNTREICATQPTTPSLVHIDAGATPPSETGSQTVSVTC